MSLYLFSLHSHMRCHIILHSSTGQGGVTPQALRIIQMLEGVPSQGVRRLPVQCLPLLCWIDQRTSLGLLRVWGHICLHVVFGEGEAWSGDSVRAGAAETRQRSRTRRVFIIFIGAKNFNAVSVMEAFSKEVDAGGSGATAYHAGHSELRVMG